MAGETLPTIGADANTWGQELNTYILMVEAKANAAQAAADSAIGSAATANDGVVAALVAGATATRAAVDARVTTVNAGLLAGKADDTAVVHKTGAETVAGVKTFSSAPVVPLDSFPRTAIVGLQALLDAKADAADLAAKAIDTLVLHKGVAESITAVKTFTANPVFNVGGIDQTSVSNLVTALSLKADAADLVSLGTTVSGKLTATTYNGRPIYVRAAGVTTVPGDFPDQGLIFTEV